MHEETSRLNIQDFPACCKVESWRIGSSGRAYKLVFNFGRAVTTVFTDTKNFGADVAITNIITVPGDQRRRGYGRHALRFLVAAARRRRFNDIRAIGVEKENEAFWKKIGFVPLNNWTNDFRYRP